MSAAAVVFVIVLIAATIIYAWSENDKSPIERKKRGRPPLGSDDGPDFPDFDGDD